VRKKSFTAKEQQSRAALQHRRPLTVTKEEHHNDCVYTELIWHYTYMGKVGEVLYCLCDG